MPLEDSVVLDVVEGNVNSPTAVLDYKFGGARSRQNRIDQIRSAANLTPTTPVVQGRRRKDG